MDSLWVTSITQVSLFYLHSLTDFQLSTHNHEMEKNAKEIQRNAVSDTILVFDTCHAGVTAETSEQLQPELNKSDGEQHNSQKIEMLAATSWLESNTLRRASYLYQAACTGIVSYAKRR